ncbi:alpha-mannosidase, partial [Escherichia coli]
FITTISEGYSPRPYYTTYNGLLDPYTVKGSFERYQQKDQHDEILIAYGYGDGGGGPTREMLETKQRLSKPLPQMPVITGDHAGKFFDRLAAAFAHSEAPVWFGELYFEYHRGTLTSIGKNKKANRKGEFLLQTIEKLYSAYRSEAYPQELLERLWKKLLFNQFHDILPGSSIGEVYQQTEEEYAALFEEGEQLIQSLVAGGTASDANHQVVYNP